MLYITISRNLNLDMLHTAPGTVFAPGIRHSAVDPDELRTVGQELKLFGSTYKVQHVGKCDICGKELCLSQVASGQAMANLAASVLTTNSLISAVAGRARSSVSGEAGVVDIGGVSSTGVLDGYSVLHAAHERNEMCEQIVRQAGVALGLALADRIFPGGVPADLVVLGGSVPMGREEEANILPENRSGIDAVVERVLALRWRQTQVKVTRSRFAGFTGLLGAVLVFESPAQ
jgi:predicted NBD/HSP70 family sugar kinase